MTNSTRFPWRVLATDEVGGGTHEPIEHDEPEKVVLEEAPDDEEYPEYDDQAHLEHYETHEHEPFVPDDVAHSGPLHPYDQARMEAEQLALHGFPVDEEFVYRRALDIQSHQMGQHISHLEALARTPNVERELESEGHSRNAASNYARAMAMVNEGFPYLTDADRHELAKTYALGLDHRIQKRSGRTERPVRMPEGDGGAPSPVASRFSGDQRRIASVMAKTFGDGDLTPQLMAKYAKEGWI